MAEQDMAEEEAQVDAELVEALAAAEGGEDEVPVEEAEAEAEAEELGEDEEAPEEAPAEEDAQAEEVAEEDDDESERDEDEPEVQEHLKDAVEGSLRLKRLLSRDSEDGDKQSTKKRKLGGSAESGGNALPPEGRLLVNKWGLQSDAVVNYVLSNLSPEDLKTVAATNFAPDRYNAWKSPAELLSRFCCEVRERSLGGGSATDVLSAFKRRWGLDVTADRKLRALPHKDLRYVLDHYDGTLTLDQVAEESKKEELEDNITTSALPENAGIPTIGRFTRLELIDPLADCAVFGDANLTFSVRLAKHRKSLGHVGRVIATTFEEIETLRERYKEIDESIKVLESHYAEVYHGVDCTRIAVDPRFKGMVGSLGAVYYNFPHSGAIQGFFDGHPIVNWRHENLMRLFFRALRSFVKPGGSVKVSSNAGAVGVRYSYIVESGIQNEFLHVETIPFMEWHLHRYGRSYGDRRDSYKRPDAVNNQSYNAQRAEADMVYCFTYAPSGDAIGKQMVRLPPTLRTLKNCTEGPFRNLQGPSKLNLAKQLHKRFVTEISGTHVG